MRRALRLCESGFPRLVVLFASVYAAIRLSAFRGLADLRASSFEPVGILWFLGSPLPDAVWFGVLGLLFVSGLVVLTGRAARPAMVVFTPCVLVVTTYRSSWGQLLWFENLLVIHLIVLTVAAVTGPSTRSGRRPGRCNVARSLQLCSTCWPESQNSGTAVSAGSAEMSSPITSDTHQRAYQCSVSNHRCLPPLP